MQNYKFNKKLKTVNSLINFMDKISFGKQSKRNLMEMTQLSDEEGSPEKDSFDYENSFEEEEETKED